MLLVSSAPFTLERIADQIKTAIEVVPYLPGYVARGRYAMPPAGYPYFVGICSPEVSSEQGNTIRQFVRTCTFQIDGWTACEEDTTSSRAQQGEQFTTDIMEALENARFDPTYGGGLFDCREFVCSSINLEGDFDPAPQGYARIVITLVLSYSIDRGL